MPKYHVRLRKCGRLKAMNIRYSMAKQGRSFATRDRAKEIAADVFTTVEASASSCIEINFQGVLALSGSFADEFVRTLRKVVSRHQADIIQLSSISPELRPFIERALEADEKPGRPDRDKVLVG